MTGRGCLSCPVGRVDEMPFNVGLPELMVVLFICLIIFGAGKLPGVGRALGQSIREFRHASQGAGSDRSEREQAGPDGAGAA